MNKTLSFVLLIAGVIFLLYGISAFHSIGSNVSRIATGSSTDKAIWLLAGGAVFAAAGFAGILGGSKSN
jgi:hypothetical protein